MIRSISSERERTCNFLFKCQNKIESRKSKEKKKKKFSAVEKSNDEKWVIEKVIHRKPEKMKAKVSVSKEKKRKRAVGRAQLDEATDDKRRQKSKEENLIFGHFRSNKKERERESNFNKKKKIQRKKEDEHVVLFASDYRICATSERMDANSTMIRLKRKRIRTSNRTGRKRVKGRHGKRPKKTQDNCKR